jgi:hypothetical protein
MDTDSNVFHHLELHVDAFNGERGAVLFFSSHLICHRKNHTQSILRVGHGVREMNTGTQVSPPLAASRLALLTHFCAT